MNVMDEYLKIIHEDISTSFKVLLEKKYKKSILDEFINTYISARYYNEDGKTNYNTIRSNAIKKMQFKKKELCNKNPEKEKSIEAIYEYIDLILYFDNMSYIENKEIRDIINSFEDKEKAENQIKELKELHERKLDRFIGQLDSDDFYLEFEFCNKVNNVEMAFLEHNIVFSEIYSEFAIHKAFNMGKIYEDKYFVAYHLLVQQVIKDIRNDEFDKRYIIRFPETIMDKKQKYKKLIEILKNDISKEKICLEVDYDAFLKNKTEYNSLIKQGFQIAIKLNNRVTKTAAMKMAIFKYIIINKELKYYTELKRTNKKFKIIEV